MPNKICDFTMSCWRFEARGRVGQHIYQCTHDIATCLCLYILRNKFARSQRKCGSQFARFSFGYFKFIETVVKANEICLGLY